MPSPLIRSLFTATALAPVFVVYAALFLFDDKPLLTLNMNRFWAAVCLLAVAGCVYGCHRILQFYATKVASGPMSIKSLKAADSSAVTFVVIYLLPLIARQVADLQLEVVFVVLVLLAVLVYHSDAYLVNPLLALPPFRYHFYEISTKEEVTYILVSRREILNTTESLEVKQISRFMFLDVKGQGD